MAFFLFLFSSTSHHLKSISAANFYLRHGGNENGYFATKSLSYLLSSPINISASSLIPFQLVESAKEEGIRVGIDEDVRGDGPNHDFCFPSLEYSVFSSFFNSEGILPRYRFCNASRLHLSNPVGGWNSRVLNRQFSRSARIMEQRQSRQLDWRKNFYLSETQETEHILDCLKTIHFASSSSSLEDSQVEDQVDSALSHCHFPIKGFHVKNALRAMSQPRIAFEFFRWAKLKNGFVPDKYALMLIIKTVGSAKMIREMEWILDRMQEDGMKKDLLLWTEVIRCYANANLTEKAFQALLTMVESDRIKPDRVVFNTLIHTHFRLGEYEEAISAFGLMNRMRISGDIPLYTTMMNIFQTKEMFVEAEALFKEMIAPDSIAFLQMINIYLKWKRDDSAVELFQQMQDKDIEPHPRICYSMLRIFKEKGMIQEYEELFARLSKQNDEKINPKLLNFNEEARFFLPFRSEKLPNAEENLNEMGKSSNEHKLVLHKSTYKFLFASHLKQNRLSELKSMATYLKESGILPDLVFYSYLLSACSKPEHEDRLGEIWEVMESMEDPIHGLLLLALQFKSSEAKDEEQVKKSCEPYVMKLSKEESDRRIYYCNSLLTFLCKAKRYGSVTLIWNLFLQHNCIQILEDQGNKGMIWDLRRLSLASCLVFMCTELSKLQNQIVCMQKEPPEEIRIHLRPRLVSEGLKDAVCTHSSVKNFLKCMNSPFCASETNENALVATGSKICYWLSSGNVYLGLDLLENERLF